MLESSWLHSKSKALFLVKLSVSLGLVVYLGCIVDWERAITTVAGIDVLLLLVAPFLALARLAAAASRWRLILADNRVSFSLRQAYNGYLVGAFYDVLLPGVTGGDVVRIGRCFRQTRCQLGTATASVLLERVCGALALLTIALAAYWFFPWTLSSLPAIERTLAVTIAGVAGIVFLVLAVLGRRIWLRWLPCEDAKGGWRFVCWALRTLGAMKGRTLGAIFVLSILFQTADIVATFLLSKALGLDVSIKVFFAIIPLVYLAICLPVSLGGLGVREGALVFLLGQFGVVPSDAVTLSFLIYLNRIVTGGLGGLLQFVEALSDKKTSRVVADTTYVQDTL